jgi:type IX secretion system PorP/SprF family membrane protein
MTLSFTILLTIMCCFLLHPLKGQDPYFSQFFANRLYLNPAWAGVEECRRLSINYRNQWPSTENPYLTYSAAYDQYLEPLHGGIGITVFSDNQGKGTITQFGISGIYSYHLNVTRSLSINAGFQTSYVQRMLNTRNFVFGDMLNSNGSISPNGAENYGNYSVSYPDFSFGLTSFYKNFYSGAAMFHLLKPAHSVSDDPDALLSRKFTFFSGALIPIYEKRLGKEFLQISPNFIYIQQKSLSQLNYGMEVLYNDTYVGGVWLRQNLGIKYSSLILSAGFAADKLRVRYSYDYQLSNPAVSLPALGSHEISFILSLNEGKKKKLRAIKCLKI